MVFEFVGILWDPAWIFVGFKRFTVEIWEFFGFLAVLWKIFRDFFGIFLGFLRLREDFSGSCVDFFASFKRLEAKIWRFFGFSAV